MMFILMLFALMPINILGISSVYIAFILSLLMLFIYRDKIKLVLIDKKNIYIFVSLLFILISNISVFILHDSETLDLIKTTLFGVFISVLMFNLSVLYVAKYEEPTYFILRNIFYCATINSFIAILVLYSEPARDIIYSIIMTSPKNLVHLTLGMRSSGLFYFGGSVMSMFNVITLYIGLVFIKKYKNRIGIFDLFCLLNILLGIFISGRLGIIAIIALFFIIFLFPERITLVSRSVLMKIISLSMCIILFIIFYRFDEFKRLIDWSLEIFINYLNGKSATSSSVDVLESMYRLPNNILLGDGIFSQSILDIDSGYVLLLFYFGIFGILSYVLLFLLNLKIVLDGNNKYFKNIYYLSLIIIIIGNFKDIYLFSSNGVTQIYFIAIFGTLMERKNDENKKKQLLREM